MRPYQMLRRSLSLFLSAVLLCMCAAGCFRIGKIPSPETGETGENGETAENGETEPQAAPEPIPEPEPVLAPETVDWEQLREANLIETLLFRYGGFRFVETLYYAEDPVCGTVYGWVDDPGILAVSSDITAGDAGVLEDTYYSFWDGEQLISASVEGRGIVSYGTFSPDPGEYPENAYPLNDRFFYDFYPAEHTITGETADTVTFRAAPDLLDGGYYICTADRETLAVLDYMKYEADGTLAMERHMTFGREIVKENISSAIGNIHDLRNVKYNIRYFTADGEKDCVLFFHLPRAWEFSLESYFDGELFFYADEGLTVPVENRIDPGDEDLVFWATNAAG